MSTADPVLLLFTTCPDLASAERIAHALVGERLAACVTRQEGARSTYRWQGEVTTDSHHFVQMDTRFGGRRVVDWLSGEQLPRIC